ncbi:hypothetical protein O181_049718 [Austropuccinia psidii MF-1]|uniref:Uncharacterized protein n=1 Tax=Austropuccinia psidii MF-1 TaxID=1389203 RepID=A0A9Q3DY14_9BASI|nr:hypothetical protein [Austropuccinia psidii MF-1]
MTIVHQAGNIDKNSDGLSRWAWPNTPYNAAYVPETAEPQITIEGINITDVGTELFEESIESHKQDNNLHIPTSLLDKDCRDAALTNSLHDIWKSPYDNGRFHFFDGILYNTYTHPCVMVLCSKMLTHTILLECQDNIYS